jgi:hypothetical protein
MWAVRPGVSFFITVFFGPLPKVFFSKPIPRSPPPVVRPLVSWLSLTNASTNFLDVSPVDFPHKRESTKLMYFLLKNIPKRERNKFDWTKSPWGIAPMISAPLLPWIKAQLPTPCDTAPGSLHQITPSKLPSSGSTPPMSSNLNPQDPPSESIGGMRLWRQRRSIDSPAPVTDEWIEWARHYLSSHPFSL